MTKAVKAKRRKTNRAAKRTRRPLRLVWVEAGSLAGNPNNWRRHPEGQMKALKSTLSELDWCGALLFNEATGRLIDGHARKKAVLPQTVVPVLVGRWSEEQELKILVTLDPLAAMAVADADKLESLLAEVDLESADLDELAAMLDDLVDHSIAEDAAPRERSRRETSRRKRGPKVMRFVLGQFTFDVERQAYDAWLSSIEAKTGSDADQVIKELKRRLKL